MCRIIYLVAVFGFFHADYKCLAAKGCARRAQNKDVEGFYTTATYDMANSDLALAGSRDNWTPGINTKVSWRAGVTNISRCSLKSIVFYFRYARQVKVTAKLFGDTVYNTIENIVMPNYAVHSAWTKSLLVKLPKKTETVQVTLYPSVYDYALPGLKRVVVNMCCKDECDSLYLNEEKPGFYVYADMFSDSATDALFGSGTVWAPMHHGTLYWRAEIPPDDLECRLYTVELEFRYSWEVDIKVKLFGSDQEIDVEMLSKPEDRSASEWLKSGEIKLPNNVEKILLKSWPSMEGPNDMPEYKNVKVTTCCVTS